jgi:DNA-binding MarR family transcriptional regulator
VTRAVAALEERGLAERQADPDDRRARLVSVTAEGRRVFARLAIRRAALIADLRERLTTDEQGTLDAAIPLLVRMSQD